MAASSSTASMIFLSFALLVFSTFARTSCAATFTNATCIEREREALLEFKRGLIDNSNLLSSWVGDDCCSWKGVRCSKRTGRVLKLDLRSPCVVSFYFDDEPLKPVLEQGNCSLTGHIHPSLMELQHLNYLDLSWNNYSYTKIPEFLGSLSNLVYLNLSNACFAFGDIPLHLGNLSNLQYLDLNIQYLRGYATVNNLEWLSGLPSLKHLDLSGISVRNAQGWLQSMSMLSSLQFLGLAFCSLPKVDPAALQVNFSTSLEFLDLSYNNGFVQCKHISGQVATSLCSITELSFLGLQGNAFSGSIPKCLSTMTNLEILDLGRNKLAGRIPSWIGRMVQPRVLNLEFNSFYGEIPMSICKLGDLRVLNLAHNNLSGSIPLCFDNLTTMSDPKYLPDTNVSYSLGVEVQMKNITQVYTSALRYLFSIDLSNNILNRDIPAELTRLCNLENLNLSQNDLWGGIPPKIANLKKLESLDLSINQLSGPIPQSLSELDSLGYLNLSFNQLSGPIPSSAHLSTFTNESYLGNDALCGPPLSKNCSRDHGQSNDIHKQHGDVSEDKIISQLLVMVEIKLQKVTRKCKMNPISSLLGMTTEHFSRYQCPMAKAWIVLSFSAFLYFSVAENAYLINHGSDRPRCEFICQKLRHCKVKRSPDECVFSGFFLQRFDCASLRHTFEVVQ
ncbi:hypothetical protein CDL15_Pgr025683 [Punica granatum]|uniref:Leucine-rich repeat-containing N-terminal plant-type domain-containing protein n=1 Tax=Punica granatum TaxID=22663 RepID=A0A218WAD7_PUNGR|nr:hypothetical protein CDL15_Pgr025683 [Punica granatum]